MDGLGWFWDMVCRLRFVFGYTIEQVMVEVPLGRAFAETAWCIENDAITRAFGGLKRTSKGYVGQETDALMAMIK